MYKRRYPLRARSSGGDAPAGAQFPSAPLPSQSMERSDSFFEAAASAWAAVLDRQADQLVSLSHEMTSGNDNPGTAIQLQAQAQKLAFFATAASTSTNTLGNAFEVLAKKQ
jgi:hypothetical protein